MKPRVFLLGDQHTTHTTKAAERKRRSAARVLDDAKAAVRKGAEGAGRGGGPNRGETLRRGLLPADPPHRQAGLVPLDALNDNEQRVLFALETNGPSKIGDLAAVAWEADRVTGDHYAWHNGAGSLPEARRNSWVRNALRRLVASGWVVQLGPGLYGPHESLEPRLGGLAVADAEDAHDAAERALEQAKGRVGLLAAQLDGAKVAVAIHKEEVLATWKALLAARKAVR